jgi:D-glycero-alpha-D-manno-heptose-7-phosphate kinase
MFYTGKTSSAGSIFSEQKKNIDDKLKLENLHKMVQLSKDLKEELLKGNIDAMGEILHTGWMYKKELAQGITNGGIDDIYEIARKNGALGGKLLGAGGGGFLLFYVKEESRSKLREALKNFKELDFKFDNKGTNIVYYNKVDLYRREE